MEAFFPEDQPLRFWPHEASIAQLACSVAWPPIIAATGYAPCVRAWFPTSRDEPEFRMATQLLEMDGERFVAATIKGDLLIAADASSSGRITVWETQGWTRQQTLLAGAPVSALDATRTYIAAGTTAGYVRVWKRQGQAGSGATFTQFFEPDLQLDHLPVSCVRLGPVRDTQESMMVVHTLGNGRVSVWRMSDAKLMGTLGRVGDPQDPDTLLAANVVAHCLAGEVLLTVSWLPGKDPLLQWINPIARKGGEIKEAGVGEALRGRGRPLCCDYDGQFVVIGFEDGMVWAWGTPAVSSPPASPSQATPAPASQSQPPLLQWQRYHAGEVGAVACLPQRLQLASAGADGCVKLWSQQGQLMAVTRLGWQVTALAINELALVAGGAAGQLQLLVLTAEDQAAEARARITADDQRTAQQPAAPGGVARYERWFDARTKAAPGGTVAAGGAYGRVADHPDAYAAFVPPRRQVTSADLMASLTGSGGAAGSSGGAAGGSAPDAAAAAASPGAAGSSAAGANGCGAAAAAGGSGKASSFNMQAAIKGAQRKPGEAADPEEEKKRAAMRALEGAGVARNSAVVLPEGSTAAMGRKCDNPSCLQREGVAALGGSQFKRCGACKSAFYCSTHCQSTHWRDGHKKECPLLADAWKQRQLQQQAEEAGGRQHQEAGGAVGPGAAASPCGGGDARQAPPAVEPADSATPLPSGPQAACNGHDVVGAKPPSEQRPGGALPDGELARSAAAASEPARAACTAAQPLLPAPDLYELD